MSFVQSSPIAMLNRSSFNRILQSPDVSLNISFVCVSFERSRVYGRYRPQCHGEWIFVCCPKTACLRTPYTEQNVPGMPLSASRPAPSSLRGISAISAEAKPIVVENSTSSLSPHAVPKRGSSRGGSRDTGSHIIGFSGDPARVSLTRFPSSLELPARTCGEQIFSWTERSLNSPRGQSRGARKTAS